jgi:site-specific recombinase XerD
VRPFHVAAWIEDFPGSKPTIKQKLAAVCRMLYDFLVVRQITRSNPAHSVRGPKYVVKKGKTPVWSREDAKTLLDSIPKDSVSGLRDLALIAAMFDSFARVSAVLKLKVDDYYHRRAPAAETPRKRRQGARYARASLARTDIGRIHCWRRPPERATFVPERKFGWNEGNGTRFEPLQRLGCDSETGQGGGFLTPVGCHTWRATGITIYLENGDRLEHAQQMAGHESSRTTKLYDRCSARCLIFCS